MDPDERSDKTISKQNIANYFISSILQPEDEKWEQWLEKYGPTLQQNPMTELLK